MAKKRKRGPNIPAKTIEHIEALLLDGKTPGQIQKRYKGRYLNKIYEIKRSLERRGALL